MVTPATLPQRGTEGARLTERCQRRQIGLCKGACGAAGASDNQCTSATHVNFDCLELDGDAVDDPFCRHAVHLFKQLSALATIYLHGEQMKPPKRRPTGGEGAAEGHGAGSTERERHEARLTCSRKYCIARSADSVKMYIEPPKAPPAPPPPPATAAGRLRARAWSLALWSWRTEPGWRKLAAGGTDRALALKGRRRRPLDGAA